MRRGLSRPSPRSPVGGAAGHTPAACPHRRDRTACQRRPLQPRDQRAAVHQPSNRRVPPSPRSSASWGSARATSSTARSPDSQTRRSGPEPACGAGHGGNHQRRSVIACRACERTPRPAAWPRATCEGERDRPHREETGDSRADRLAERLLDALAQTPTTADGVLRTTAPHRPRPVAVPGHLTEPHRRPALPSQPDRRPA